MAHPKISYGLMFLALGGLTISKLIRGSTKDLCGDKQFCILIVEWLHESTYVKNCIKLHIHTSSCKTGNIWKVVCRLYNVNFWGNNIALYWYTCIPDVLHYAHVWFYYQGKLNTGYLHNFLQTYIKKKKKKLTKNKIPQNFST